MKVAVLAEADPAERRVALVPVDADGLAGRGVEVVVQAGAGREAGFRDAEYEDGGVTIAPDAVRAAKGADVVIKVSPPTDEEVAALGRGTVLVSLLDPLGRPERVGRLAEGGVTAFALELVPRTTRAQSMDVLSSQATLAGYKAVLLGANELPKILPMLMTAAGTIRPGRVLVLGAGVAGLQAIATARRLGARVEAFDVRPEVREQVESLGADFLETEHEVQAESEGGYAKELSAEQHRRELELIGSRLPEIDLVVTTAQIPGRPAPLLVDRAMLESMAPGSVVVDLAAGSGGNCEVSRPGEKVVHAGVIVLGPLNLPAELPVHASQMFSKNVTAFLGEMLEDGALAVDLGNDVLGPACAAHAGEVRHGPTRERLEEARRG